MGTWQNIAIFPVCLIVTIIGLLLSFVAWRKKGLRSGLRGVAWSLLPLAMWLTHSVGLVGRIVSAVVRFGAGFVFSPEAWLGVILVGISVVLFLVSGGIPLARYGRKHRERDKQKAARRAGRDSGGHPTAAVAPARRQAEVPAGDDDLSDVQEILRRRGIK
jgi:hypothetical protein